MATSRGAAGVGGGVGGFGLLGGLSDGLLGSDDEMFDDCQADEPLGLDEGEI